MISILNKDFKKIDVLRKYEFAQYTKKSRDIGTFEIHLKIDVNDTKYLYQNSGPFFVLFDDTVLGKVEKVKKDSDNEYNRTVILSGRLCEYIFTKRVCFGTIKFSGKSYKLIEELIMRNIAGDIIVNSPRYVPIEIVYKDESKLNSMCSVIEKQITGGYIWDHVKDILDLDKINFELIPEVKTEHEYKGKQTNISKWFLYISLGNDLTNGDNAVMLSQLLSNISNSDYELNTEAECNVAYVAGEGEEVDRKWYQVYTGDGMSADAWDREELWVDARDIQSKNAEGNSDLTSEEYEKLIEKRGNEKLSENALSVAYGATVVPGKFTEEYGKRYKLGDWVMVRDMELGVETSAQITGYIKSWSETGMIQDIEVTYGIIKKDIVKRTQNLLKELEVTSNNVTYVINNAKDMIYEGVSNVVYPIPLTTLDDIFV